jgi:hypothetical protein
MPYLTRKGVIGVAIAALLVSSAGYLYGATSVAPGTMTVTGTTTLTKSATVTETSTAISTAIWTETTYFPMPLTGQLGPWNRTTDYPLPLGALSCVVDNGFVYCVGGGDETSPRGTAWLNRTYFAPLSPTGVGHWTRTTDYPLLIARASCVVSSDYIYCVGGFAGPASEVTADVFYASISPSGIGTWKQTTSFPNPIGVPPCIVDSSYIYCVTQHPITRPTIPAGDSYFAHLSAAGVGNWTESSQLPSNPLGCSASGGYAYCFGGASCPPGPSFDCPSPSYYAPLSPDGVGAWIRTNDLPTAAQDIYIAGSSYEYFFATPSPLVAHLSPNGIGPWTTSTPYPEDSPASCVADGAYVYCIGTNRLDFTPSQHVYFTRIG